MADILIRMEMPKTCCQCDLKIYDPEKRWDENGIERIGAWVCKRTREIIWNTQRGDNCPLISLPEGHGRLIDADALIDALETQDYSCAPDTLEDWTPQDMTVAEIADITHAPTIVPAEGGTDDV